jgi:Fe-S-cluster-containing hydrogenase component 2
MAYMITAQCINCNACEMECPVRAISAGPSQFVINAEVCIECDGYYPVPRCKWVCPVEACVPARPSYQHKARALANRGSPPLILRPAPSGSQTLGVGRQEEAVSDSVEESISSEALQMRLERLQNQLILVTNKETRAELRYAIARLQWQLGQISDAEFAQIEGFYESFTYEWC